MKISSLIATFLAASTVFFGMTMAQAQQPSRITPFPVAPSPTSDKVDISVSYQFQIDGDAATLQDQAKLSEEGRRALYVLLGTECETLLDTIAETCSVRRANVNSQINQRSRTSGRGIRVSGSATYSVRFRRSNRSKGDN